ncbi:hypothetical protein HPB47_014684 [Ixodes persulcatus]|uniref:Uncharacterized protein n=1 Tax=Ixodes persulcatus TaxID=34615 RepID=A0AC60QX87_IXOPE|nr:hypothetical protein HPB47_014684 [Ixodes persulcatus]
MKYLHTRFDRSCRQFPTMSVSVSGGYIPDFHQEADLLPPSVRIVILHVATNDLASQDPQPVRQHYVDLLHHIQTRPGIQLVVCSHVLPRIISRNLHFPNRHFTDAFNHQAGIFNRQLTDICMSTPGQCFYTHNLQACGRPRVLAADGLHPSFAGVHIMSRNLRALIPCLLRRTPRPQGASAPDLHWPTLGEGTRMQHTEARRGQPRRTQPRRIRPHGNQRPN